MYSRTGLAPPTFGGSIEGGVEVRSLAVVVPQHLPVDLVGPRVHGQHQVESGPQPPGDAPEALLEVGSELGGPPRVRLQQALQRGPQLGLQHQGGAQLAHLHVLHKLLPPLLGNQGHDTSRPGSMSL